MYDGDDVDALLIDNPVHNAVALKDHLPQAVTVGFGYFTATLNCNFNSSLGPRSSSENTRVPLVTPNAIVI